MPGEDTDIRPNSSTSIDEGSYDPIVRIYELQDKIYKFKNIAQYQKRILETVINQFITSFEIDTMQSTFLLYEENKRNKERCRNFLNDFEPIYADFDACESQKEGHETLALQDIIDQLNKYLTEGQELSEASKISSSRSNTPSPGNTPTLTPSQSTENLDVLERAEELESNGFDIETKLLDKLSQIDLSLLTVTIKHALDQNEIDAFQKLTASLTDWVSKRQLEKPILESVETTIEEFSECLKKVIDNYWYGNKGTKNYIIETLKKLNDSLSFYTDLNTQLNDAKRLLTHTFLYTHPEYLYNSILKNTKITTVHKELLARTIAHHWQRVYDIELNKYLSPPEKKSQLENLAKNFTLPFMDIVKKFEGIDAVNFSTLQKILENYTNNNFPLLHARTNNYEKFLDVMKRDLCRLDLVWLQDIIITANHYKPKSSSFFAKSHSVNINASHVLKEHKIIINEDYTGYNNRLGHTLLTQTEGVAFWKLAEEIKKAWDQEVKFHLKLKSAPSAKDYAAFIKILNDEAASFYPKDSSVIEVEPPSCKKEFIYARELAIILEKLQAYKIPFAMIDNIKLKNLPSVAANTWDASLRYKDSPIKKESAFNPTDSSTPRLDS